MGVGVGVGLGTVPVPGVPVTGPQVIPRDTEGIQGAAAGLVTGLGAGLAVALPLDVAVVLLLGVAASAEFVDAFIKPTLKQAVIRMATAVRNTFR
jgi:hypothetical protein